MNELTINIERLFQKLIEYTEKGKYKIQIKIALFAFSAVMIYTFGKSIGEFIYYISI